MVTVTEINDQDLIMELIGGSTDLSHVSHFPYQFSQNPVEKPLIQSQSLSIETEFGVFLSTFRVLETVQNTSSFIH